MKEVAYYAAGCFWGVEERFKKTDGVLETTVGYMGGHTENPTYEEVCSKGTGHAEAVEVIFDSEKISFRELIEVFFDLHDPTQVDRQGPDVGDQYRSEIFTTSEQQKEIAQEELEKQKQKWKAPIATKISPAPTFYPAEDYHQDYVEKRNAL